MSLLDTGWELNTPTVISDVVDGQTLLINLRTGTYYALGQQAEQVWRALATGVPGASLLDGPDDPRRGALAALVEQAVAAGLLRQSPIDVIQLDRPVWEGEGLDLEEGTGISDLLGADTSPNWGEREARPAAHTGSAARP